MASLVVKFVAYRFDDSKLLLRNYTRKFNSLGQFPKKRDGKEGNGFCLAITSE